MIFPNSQRINRGNYETKQLVDACRANDVTDIIIVQEHRGVPGKQCALKSYVQEHGRDFFINHVPLENKHVRCTNVDAIVPSKNDMH